MDKIKKNTIFDIIFLCVISLHCVIGRVFSSGLGATMSLSNILKTGDHILCSDDVYGG